MTNEKSSNTVWHNATVTRPRRETLNKHRSAVLWFTGLSGSGKSTLAHTLEERLHMRGCHTYVFDGDNVRHGLCSDLGFTAEDRSENIRRIAEMTKLFVDAGVIALTAFISPHETDRQKVRELIGDDYIEIYCECPIEVCEERDVKGLYAKARQGLIDNFTGISAPYDIPEHADIIVDTSGKTPLRNSANLIIDHLIDNDIIQPR